MPRSCECGVPCEPPFRVTRGDFAVCEECMRTITMPHEGTCELCGRISTAPHGWVADGKVMNCMSCSDSLADVIRSQRARPVVMAPPSDEELEALGGR